MITAFSDPAVPWPHDLSTRRMIHASCEVAFDFDWRAVFNHNRPTFSGLQDLSQAISQFATMRGKTPLLLLSDKTDVAFNELVTDSRYVAIVDIRDFRAHAKEDYDRSALFFLNAFSPHSNTSAASVGLATPLRVQQLLKTFEDADLEALTNIFSTSTASVIADAATAAKRRVAVEEFERLLSENANEHRFQPWFKSNAWVLGSDCVRILDQRRIDLGKIADLLVEGYDGRADVVELKRPGSKFWQSGKDHDNYIPHIDLVAAITQAQNYQFALERRINDKETFDNLGAPIAKPASLLIHGRSYDWIGKQFEAQRILNAGFTNLNVITYDQVLRRARVIMGGPTAS